MYGPADPAPDIGLIGQRRPDLRMAYIIIHHNDQEVARHPLIDTAVTLGRAPDCELRVHDILLSRRHCRIEPDGDGWAVADLGSKNGTRIGGDVVFRRSLADCDVIRMGKTAVRFRTGAFVPGAPKAAPLRRPADPFEALAGTVRDFTYRPAVVGPTGQPFPTPRPSPSEPAAYEADDVRSMVSQLVSSSWDSIYEGASRPDPMVAHACAAAERAVRRKRPREPRVDISLQVQPGEVPDAREDPADESNRNTSTAVPLPSHKCAGLPAHVSASHRARSARWRHLCRGLVLLFQWMPLTVLLWS